MIKLRENEEAVSPVIGVILMVAITVILAAVIAAFVFGMAGNVDAKNRLVAATASSHVNESNMNVISITYQGGADAKDVIAVNWSVNGSEPKYINGSETLFVGSNNITIGGKPGEKDHVVVTATFNDGSSQVILDTYV